MRLLNFWASLPILASGSDRICSRDTCINGDCEFGLCLCHKGWSGEGCTEKVCDCENGTCDQSTKTCICEDHWGGERCEIPVCDDCSSQGGECQPGGVCKCKEGWTGSRCSKAFCSQPCENGGRCTAPDLCTCKDNWSGPNCKRYGPKAKICSFTASRVMLFDESIHFVQKNDESKCSVSLFKSRDIEIELRTDTNALIARSMSETIILSQQSPFSTNFGENRQEFTFPQLVIISTNEEVWIKYTGSEIAGGLCSSSVSQTSDLLLPNGKLPSHCYREPPIKSKIKNAQLADTCDHLMQLGNFNKCAKLIPIAADLMSKCVSELSLQCSDSHNTDCLCHVMSGWASTCAQYGFEVEDWRRADLCPEPNCPKNQIWSESVDLCSPNCADKRNENSYPCPVINRFPGCTCPEKQILREDGICISEEACGCTLNDEFYVDGSVLSTNEEVCTCKGLSWTCKRPDATPLRCRLFGAGHIDDFEGGQNSLHSHGNYLALQLPSLSIKVEFSQCAGDQYSICLHKVAVDNENGYHMRLGPSDAIFIDGERVLGIHENKSVRIYGSAQTSVIEILELDIVIAFVPGVSVMIEYRGTENVEGICAPKTTMAKTGNYNVDFQHFSTNYNILSRKNHVLPVQKIGNCAHERFEMCQVFVAKDLKECNHVIPPEIFISRCQADICNCYNEASCHQVICESVAEYVRRCKNALVSSLKKEIMTPEICVYECGKNEIWSDSVCPLEETCKIISSKRKSHCLKRISACSCKEGFYRNDLDECLPLAQCPCYDNDGLAMYPGETSVNSAGENCSCSKGVMTCKSQEASDETFVRGKRNYLRSNCAYGLELQNKETANVCNQEDFSGVNKICGCVAGFWDSSLQKCVSTRQECTCPEYLKPKDGVCHMFICRNGKWLRKSKPCAGECSVYGTRHMKTFDGKSLAFSSNCEIILATNKCKSKPSESFTVTLENKQCQGTNLICTKQLRVYHSNGKVFSVFGNYEPSGRRKIVKTGDPPRLGVRQVGLYLIIQVNPDVVVLWDVSLRVHVIVENNLSGDVCGMCGNFNRDNSDDFTGRNGAIVTSGDLLAEGWKFSSRKSMCSAPSSDENSSSTCLATDQSKNAYAIETCQLIYSDLFEKCRAKVDPTAFYEDCKESACSCSRGGECECLCATIASFARACAVAGEPVRWRSPDLCPLMCEAQEKQPGGPGFEYNLLSKPYFNDIWDHL